MPTTYLGVTIPEYSDPADVPAALRGMIDGLVPKGGAIMTGPIGMGGSPITGLPLTPSNPSDAASKQYVDTKFAAITLDWASISDKPTSFPPSAHGHVASEIPPLDAAKIETGVFPIARLPSSTSATSTSTTTVATSSAVKTAYDLANHAHPYISNTTPHQDASNSYGNWRVRNIVVSASTPTTTGRETGDIWFQT